MAKRSSSRRSRTAFSKSAFTAGKVQSSVSQSGSIQTENNLRPDLPVDFCRALEAQLGVSEATALCGALDGVCPVSVRFNPYKIQQSGSDAGGESDRPSVGTAVADNGQSVSDSVSKENEF